MNSIVHPNYLAALSAMFVETVTIYDVTETRGAYGEVEVDQTDSGFGEDPFGDGPFGGAEAQFSVRAAVAPVLRQGEHKGFPRTVEVGQYEVGLQGYYPSLTAKHRVEIWGRDFDIIGVYQSPLKVYTQLTVREVT